MVRKFAWGLDVSGSLQGAGGVGGLLAIEDASGSYYPLYDAAHNVIGLYNNSGGMAAAYEFDPFGNLQTSGGSYAANNPFRFSTKYTDTETTLIYYGHRYYHPKLGRFINRDPIAEEGGINLYGFCGNDGVNRYDYLGMSFWDWLKSVFTGGSSSSSSTAPTGNESQDGDTDKGEGILGDTGITVTPGKEKNIYVAENKKTGETAIYEYDPATRTAKRLEGTVKTGSEIRATHDAWGEVMDEGSDSPDLLANVTAFNLGEAAERGNNGAVRQRIEWKDIPRKGNGMILGAFQITRRSPDGKAEVMLQRTEAWFVTNGKVWTTRNGQREDSKGDQYSFEQYVKLSAGERIEWRGNMIYIPDATPGPGWKSGSPQTDPSRGIPYWDGLLFPLDAPGLHREFIIENNPAQQRWDIVESCVTQIF